MKIKIIIVLFLFFVLNAVEAFAYITYPNAVLTIDKDFINTGETVKATVEITIPDFAKLLKTEDDISIEGWVIQDFHFKQDIADENKFILTLYITTFDSKLDSVSKIKLSYVNKEDLLDDTFFCDKFYFFSNSVPIKITSNLSSYQREEIFDIKNIKEMNVPTFFYILCIVFIIIVIFGIYSNILILKMRKNNEIHFSPREIAIRNLNNICIDDKQKTNINNNCYLMSRILKVFLLDELAIKNKEMTTTELLSVLSEEKNVFHKSYSEIFNLFKIYDNVKYSLDTLSLEDFFDIFNKTKKMIENLSANTKVS